MFLAAPIRIALAVTAFALAGGVQAQVYKCKVDGKTTFSDRPCATDAKPINVRPASGHSGAVAPVPTAAPAASVPINSSNNPQAVVAKMERDRALRDIGHDIEIEHSKIREEEESMSRELAALRNKKQYANNNLAGAVWEQSISAEMAAVVAGYEQRIQSRRERVKRLEADRAKMVAGE